jgi:transcriptional regulator with XRE-family HTH domain
MGMTQKAYSKIETGETKLTVYHLIQIGEILEVGINELINPEISAVYHGHHTDTRKGIAMTKKPNDDLIELYENQIASKDREIDMLHKYIARLEKGEPQ